MDNLKLYSRVLFSLLIISCTTTGFAQDLGKYHALFIGKFIDYIEWPQGNSQLTIGVIGDPNAYAALESGLGARGKAKVKKVNSASEINDCQIIFIPSSQNKEFEAINSATANKPVLVITESEQYARKGATISFYLDNGKLRFLLNESTASQHKLKVSSGLTSLATVL